MWYNEILHCHSQSILHKCNGTICGIHSTSPLLCSYHLQYGKCNRLFSLHFVCTEMQPFVHGCPLEKQSSFDSQGNQLSVLAFEQLTSCTNWDFYQLLAPLHLQLHTDHRNYSLAVAECQLS